MSTATLRMPLYFDLEKVETIAEEEASITLDYTPPVILPEDAELETNHRLAANEPEPMAQDEIASQAPPRASSPLLWLLGSLGILLLFMLVLDAYHFVAQQYASSFFLGTLFFGLTVTITAAVLTLSWRAYKNIRALRTVSVLQEEGRQLMETDGYGGAMPYINKVMQFYEHRPDIKARLEGFYVTVNDSHHDREVCTLFSSQVMKDIDQQAYRVVTQRSQETAVMVMISQIAILDAILTLWRNVRMIRDVATLYGARPGFFGSMSLIGSVLQNLIYAGASEVVADGVAEMMGSSMLSIMSAQAAQGLGSGVLTARLGLHAIRVCRPLPFTDENKPRLKDIRREIISSLKGIFESKAPKNKMA